MKIHNESIVSYETAKLLKEAGFNDTCRAFWKVWNGKINLYNCDKGQCFDYCCNNMLEMYNDSSEENVAAPTLQMALKWLREVHDLHIMVNCIGKVNYDPIVQRFDGKDFEIEGVEVGTTRRINGKWENVRRGFKTYEEACEAAIKYCLEILI